MADPDSTASDDAGVGERVSVPDETADESPSESDNQSERDGDTDPNAADAEMETLREQVEQKYDFDDFGPADMAEMSAEEWEAAFDAETWITDDELLDRVERDLLTRVANRDVFARIERHEEPPRILAYSDEGYAIVYPDGSIEGEGTVLRDVKPTVALCSMDSYEVPEEVPRNPLPEPEAVPEGGGELGNWMLQAIAGAQLLAGLVLIVGGGLATAGVIGDAGTSIALLFVAGFAFVGVALVLFFTVANARLSDKFRAEEYRDRLRAIGLEDGERPDFVPEIEPEYDGERSDADSNDEAGA
ncbi:DUF7319 domain-containing protein [Haloarcula pelagica]|uniref:DUF7319 domain-containing protein n=1 Tax=Haloarcula pelagica TaxID=3033389 RepID=UPI0024C3B080|nr:hypothetical protein [Halomicroarcula sp. YJ-61-S]